MNTYAVTLLDETELEARGRDKVAAVRSLGISPASIARVVLRERGR